MEVPVSRDAIIYSAIQKIEPRSGTSFELRQGQFLKVIDPEGEQVSDMLAFRKSDMKETISSGRSLDYAGKIYLTTGDPLYSNRSNVMLDIVEDTVGRHDFFLTPCSADTFRIIYGHPHPHHGCHGNFLKALAAHGVASDDIPVAFNIFMNVAIDLPGGTFRVEPPKSRSGDYIVFEAKMDVIVALTACSAEQSNNYAFKPVHYQIGQIGE